MRRARRAAADDASPQPSSSIGDLGERGVYVGYSMGGRLALRLALERPELVRALVLVSATAGIADRSRARRPRRRRRAARRIGRARRRRRVPRPLACATDVRDRSGRRPGTARAARLSQRYLAHCLRVARCRGRWNRCGTGSPKLKMPVTLVTGTTRRQVRAARASPCSNACAGDVVHMQLDGGHALPLEQPAVLGGLIASFATSHGEPRLADPQADREQRRRARTGSVPSPRNAAMSHGGSWRVHHRRTGAIASGSATQREQRPRIRTRRTPRPRPCAPAMHPTYNTRARGAPNANCQRALARDRSVSTSRTLLASRIAARGEPDGERRHPRDAGKRRVLHVRAADGRDEPEEHEHHDLAEAEVAVRPRTARVGHRGDDARRGPTSRSHGFTTIESTPPTTAATPNEQRRRVAHGAPARRDRSRSSRTGPRRCASVPRTPSE